MAAAERKRKYSLTMRATNSSSFSFSNHFQSVPKHGSMPKECKLRFNPSSANSFSNLERSQLTRFRDRAGQRWKANAGPCFPAKGASTERMNSAPCRGFMSMREPIFDGFFVDFYSAIFCDSAKKAENTAPAPNRACGTERAKPNKGKRKPLR